jgi:hypothetical protein
MAARLPRQVLVKAGIEHSAKRNHSMENQINLSKDKSLTRW